MLCDLHTHSYFSDGSDSPARLVALAEEAGLSAIALCDHNTVKGLPEFVEAGKTSVVEAVPGVEFSVDYQGKELHILALWVASDAWDRVEAMMEEAHRRKEESNRRLAEALVKAGYAVDYNAIRTTNRGNVNRAHFAVALTEKGYTASVREAFATILSPKAGYYQQPKRISAFEILDFIASVGAVSVLAHPFLNLSEEELRLFLPQAKEHSLCGMETLYSLFSEEETAKAKALCREFDLLESGGSDYHGTNKPDLTIGVGRGNLKIPYAFCEKLKPR